MAATMTTANTILEQLGGGKFVAMTGAKSFVGSEDSLMFALPSRFAKNGINKVRVTLTAMDDYTVEFFSIRGINVKEKGKVEGVYAENLQTVFTQFTGLDTRL